MATGLDAAVNPRTVRSRIPVAWMVRRCGSALLVLFGVTLLTFFVLERLPGSAASQMLGPEATPEEVAAFEQRLGLDTPVAERYLRWLGAAAVGDLGQSVASRQQVAAVIKERAPVSIQLVLGAVLTSLLIAVPAALVSARHPDRIADRAILAASMAGLSVPGYVLALVLVLTFSVGLGLLPAIGYTSPGTSIVANVRGMLLPSLAIALPLSGLYTRVLRADLLQRMNQEEYVTLAVAKGAGPWRVILNHLLRNSAGGLVTLVTLNLGLLLGSTVVIEQIFALPGLGQLLLQAVTIRDAPMVQGIVLLLGTSVVLATLAGDLLCSLLDPRATQGSRPDG